MFDFLLRNLYYKSGEVRRCADIVDYLIIDSPVFMNILYNEGRQIHSDVFNKLVFELFNGFDNLNFFMVRPETKHQETGRIDNAEQSVKFDSLLLKLLKEYNVPVKFIKANWKSAKQILKHLKLDSVPISKTVRENIQQNTFFSETDI